MVCDTNTSGNRMKILHVYKNYLPETYGGLEQTIFQICQATTRLGTENSVFTLSHSINDSPVHRQEATVHLHQRTFEIASCGFSLTALAHYKQFVHWADVIHYHYPWPFADLLHCLHRVQKPSVVTYHSDIVRQKKLDAAYSPLKKKFLGSMHRIIATSENYAQSSQILNLYRSKLAIIPFGLDPATYPVPPQSRIDFWDKNLGSNFFLFVGVLRYYKGLHILLQAMRGAPYTAVIVGAGPIEKELKEEAEQLGLKNIHFLGFQSDEDKMALLSLCCGVVFPSNQRSEAFGITLLEALMAGKPMISSELGTGTSFVNADQETGFVVEPNSPTALRNAMDTLHANEDLAQKMGTNARGRFETHFTAEQMGRAYLQQYRDVLEGN